MYFSLFPAHASVLSILPDYAVQRGVGKAQAGLLLSVIGISNIVGRLVAGYLADRPQLDVIVINAGALLVGGITCFAIPATDKYPLLVAEAAVFGLCMGKTPPMDCISNVYHSDKIVSSALGSNHVFCC